MIRISLFLFSIFCLLPLAHAGWDFSLEDEAPIYRDQPQSYLSARHAYMHGYTEQAGAFFSDLLVDKHIKASLLQRGYEVLLHQGKVDEAVLFALRYHRQANGDMLAYLLRIMGSVKESRFGQAAFLLDEVKSYLKGKPYVHMEHATLSFTYLWIMAGDGRYDEAILRAKALRESQKIFSRFLELQIALLLELAGRMEEAEIIYDDLVEKHASHPYRFVALAGNFYRRMHKPEKARSLYQAYQAQHPELYYFVTSLKEMDAGMIPAPLLRDALGGVVEVLMEAARAFYRHGVYHQSMSYVQMVRYLAGDRDELWFFLGNYYATKERYDQAAFYFKQVSEASDFYLSAQVGVAESTYYRGEPFKAAWLFYQLAARYPDSYQPYLVLAELYRKDQYYRRASLLYSRVLQQLGDVDNAHAPIYFARAICYERLNRWVEAERDFLRALDLAPGHAQMLNYLAYSWVERGESLDRARAMLEEAVAAQPDDGHILDSMGWVLFKLGELEQAAYYLERAASFLPFDPVVNEHLGKVYEAQGRMREAGYQRERVARYGD